MELRRSYGQFCGLARALDHVGDRWTLLVVRELLLGPKSFAALLVGLPGIGPSLLTERLNGLRRDGLVDRNAAPARSKAVAYSLTPAGQELLPVIMSLIRWGGRWMADGPGADQVDARWAPLALAALLDNDAAGDREPGVVLVDIDGVVVSVINNARSRRVRAGPHGQAATVVVSSLPDLLAVAAGVMSLEQSRAVVSGNERLAASALEPIDAPPPGHDACSVSAPL